ncbi:MAG: hypothetical protein A3E87_01480 [Gammaproteobacteria bacterium RIFCSPHIGHO2_12_FULL_35_23]|nr:MAG: hypothetical protein A3E87_01480 [Gammaproteobacteria bacterium RIFCSPHIGHO2_12_FULL_35_23]
MQKEKKTTARIKALLLYSLVSMFLVFEMGVQVSPSVMASNLMHDLNLSAYALGIMSGVYFYTYTLMQIPSGLLFDRFKPKIIIVCAITICSSGALLFGFSSSFYFGCLARILMGLGSAFAFVSVLVIAADLFESKYFALLTGITQMLAAFGAVSGQLPVSIMVSHFGWRDTIIFLGLVGLCLAFLVFITLNYETKIKYISKANHWTSEIILDLKYILRNNQTWYVALYACLLWAPMSGFASLWGVPFLIKFNHLSSNSAALYSSMMWLGLAVASPLLGAFSTAINNRITPLTLSALLGFLAFILVVNIHMASWMLAVLLFIAGAACAGQALSFAVVTENNSSSVKATAIAFNNMAVVISGAIFQPLIGKIISLHGQLNADSYQEGCFVILGCYLVAFLISALFIKKLN